MDLTLEYEPRRAFVPYHMRTQKRAVLVCHRRAGKTVALIADTIDAALQCPKPNGRFQIIAPLYKQAKDIAWTYLVSMTEFLGTHRNVNQSELWVEVPSIAGTPARVRLYGADDPDRLRGIYSDGMALDEFKDMDPRMMEEVVLPALADRNGTLTLSGTPGGYDEFYNRYQHALHDPDWFVMLLKASESGILEPDVLEGLAKEMPPPKYAQEMECDFSSAAEAQFIPTSLIEEAIARREPPDANAPVVIGVDVARFGDDRSVILTRRGRVLEDVISYSQTDTVMLSNEVMRWADKVRPQMIYVDGAGVGGGVVDYIQAAGYPVRDVQVGTKADDTVRWANKRVELWGEMRDWLKTASLRIDRHTALALQSELLAPTYKYTLSGQTALEKKEDMKKRGIPSPDIADALALTFFERLAPAGLNRAVLRTPQPATNYVMR
jgi:hypothetical protein